MMSGYKQKLGIRLWLLPIVFYLIFSGVFADEPDLDRASAQIFLSQFSYVLIKTNSSAGNGHIASTLDLIEGLNDLGYQGPIILDERFISYFKILAPELLTNPRYSFRSFSPLDLHDPSDQPHLLLTGAGDFFLDSYEEATRTVVTIKLAPPFWGHDRWIAFRGPYGRFDNPFGSEMHQDSLFVRSRKKSELVSYAKTHAPNLASTIKYLLNNTKRPWSLAYGFGQAGTGRLARLAIALGNSRKNITRAGLFGPTTIVLVSQLDPTEIHQFKDVFKYFLTEREKKIHLVIATPETYEQELRKATKNTVIVLKLGIFPQFLYKGLLQYSTLPVVVAGTGALNQARVLGKPHLVTRIAPHSAQNNRESLNTFMRLSNLRELEIGTAIKDTEQAFEALSDQWENPDSTEAISKFIASALNPKSTYSRVLRTAVAEYRKCNELIAALNAGSKIFLRLKERTAKRGLDL